jgi:beta-N-acetylhexosaminidase
MKHVFILALNVFTLFMGSVIYASWAEEILAHLTPEEKIGQLFMIAAVSDEQDNEAFIHNSPYHIKHSYTYSLIIHYHVGGIIFLGTSSIRTQYVFTQKLQKMSKFPLLIAQDCEWGLGMRMPDAIAFAKANILGKLADTQLIYAIGKEIGRQCKLMGIHINLAPVADVDTNPLNPIIADRSFGNNPTQVSICASAFMHGMHAAGILTCAKHFPGHGDTTADSHCELPLILHNRDRLDAIELYPFKELITAGVDAVMIAHLAIPALEPDIHRPSSLSTHIVTNLLRKKFNFNGLIITDGLGMSSVTKNFPPGYAELEALKAGNDILLCPCDVPKAVELIKEAINNKEISIAELDAHVLRILRAKEKICLSNKPLSADEVYAALHSAHAYELNMKARL